MDDYEDLREELIEYYGSASPIYPVAFMYAEDVRNASIDELKELARQAGKSIPDDYSDGYQRTLK